MVTVRVETGELFVCLLTSSSSSSPSKPLFLLAAEGVQVRVTLVLLVLKTVEVAGMNDVTRFFATNVTVGPAEITVWKSVVRVTAFGVLVWTDVVRVVVV
jgi:hypothetical protein